MTRALLFMLTDISSRSKGKLSSLPKHLSTAIAWHRHLSNRKSLRGKSAPFGSPDNPQEDVMERCRNKPILAHLGLESDMGVKS